MYERRKKKNANCSIIFPGETTASSNVVRKDVRRIPSAVTLTRMARESPAFAHTISFSAMRTTTSVEPEFCAYVAARGQ